MVTVKKLSMVITGAALSTFCLGLEAAHAHPGHSSFVPHDDGSQDFLLVPPDASDRPAYSVFTGVVTFLATGEETGGQFSLFDITVPLEAGPPPHIHSQEDEAMYILDGQASILTGNETVLATPGTFAYLPRGRRHAYQNTGTAPLRMLVLTTSSGFEGFFREEGRPVIDRSNPPPPLLDFERIEQLSVKYGAELADSPDPSGPIPGLGDFLVVPPGTPSRPSFNVAGGLYTSLATGEETSGQFSLFDVLLPPQGGPGQLQSNAGEAEPFYVLDGEVTFQIGDQTTVGTPGTSVYLPQGTPYAFQNLGTTPARTLLLRSPTPVPEPSSWLGLLGFGTYIGARLVLKSKHKKQKSARSVPELSPT